MGLKSCPRRTNTAHYGLDPTGRYPDDPASPTALRPPIRLGWHLYEIAVAVPEPVGDGTNIDSIVDFVPWGRCAF